MTDPQRPNEPPPPCDRNWLELPRDVTASILSRVGSLEILTTVQRVCSTWRVICRDPSMWRSIDMRSSSNSPSGGGGFSWDTWDWEYLDHLCRLAVDRSGGGLLVLDVEHFVNDDLLKYVVDRSSQLKCLRLLSCYTITDEAFAELAPKLPLLEELDISFCSFSKEVLEVIGRCCPLLKTLKNCQGYSRSEMECDEEAQAIAENMHGLRHLQIFGNKLTNQGLQAILDGCPHLESLDLRHCFHVSMDSSLKRRCDERIRDLRCPYDSTDDFPHHASIHNLGSSEEDYPSGFSEIDEMSDVSDDGYEFSGDSDLSDPYAGIDI